MTSAPDTVIGALLDRARAHPSSIAYSAEAHGIWTEVTYADLVVDVGRAAGALRASGVGPGDRIVLMGDPSPSLLVVDLAAQLLGVVPIALYPSTTPEEVGRQVGDLRSPLFFAGSQEYVDLLLAAGAVEPRPRVVVVDDRGMFDYGVDVVDRYGEWLEAATPLAPEEVDRLGRAIDADAAAFLFVTSGTTGRAKAVSLSHRNILSAWTSVLALAGEPTVDDRVLVDLPLAHLGGRVVGSYAPIVYGYVPHYPGSVESIESARVQVVPTIAMGTPRSWGRAVAQITVGTDTSTPVKRTVVRAALGARRRVLDGASWLGPLAGLLHHAALRPALEKLGYSGLRTALVVGAAVPDRVEEEWRLLGVELREVYGTVETSGAVTVRAVGSAPGGAGRVLPGIEVDIGSGDEILVRGANVGAGEEGDGGWWPTGDVGSCPAPGELSVTDRRANRLTGGTGAYPAELEQELLASPYVAGAVVVELATELGVLVELELEAVAEWARAHRVTYTSASSLTSLPEVSALLNGELQAANERLTGLGRPRLGALRILPRELDPGADELTPTRIVRRAIVAARYASLFEERTSNP